MKFSDIDHTKPYARIDEAPYTPGRSTLRIGIVTDIIETDDGENTVRVYKALEFSEEVSSYVSEPQRKLYRGEDEVLFVPYPVLKAKMVLEEYLQNTREQMESARQELVRKENIHSSFLMVESSLSEKLVGKTDLSIVEEDQK